MIADVALVDSGLCNLSSVRNAVTHLGYSVAIVAGPADLENAERIILPGVGSYAEGMARLGDSGLDQGIITAAGRGAAILGICLGMQLLAEHGDESGGAAGLGLIPGNVRRMTVGDPKIRIPHMGWNDITSVREDPLFTECPSPLTLYFAHSYALENADPAHILATTDVDGDRIAIVRRDNVTGIQAHPEKSQQHGLKLLENWLSS